jgi:phage portal protein BeeE
MRFPWTKKPVAAPVDVAALVKEAATLASQETAKEMARTMPGFSPMPGAPYSNPQLQGSSKLPLYAYNYPWQFYTPQAPTQRPKTLVSLEDLRIFADRYDVLRSCIQHLKREVFAVPIEFVAQDEKDKSTETETQIKQAQELFSSRPGMESIWGFGRTRQSFEGMVIEDVSVIGMAAVYFARNFEGQPVQALPIDASTIRPRVDAFGWPGPGEIEYEQWVYGIKIGNGFTRDDLFFRGLPTNDRSYTPYSASPVEWLVQTVMRGMKSDQWNLSWLTDGNTPSDMIALPQEWTPTQVMEFAEDWDALLNGNTKARQRTKFVPGGSQKVANNGRKDADFTQMEDSIMRRTCSIMGVQPASIGYAGDQYKESQGESMDSTSEFGAGVLLEFRADLYNDILQRMGLTLIECRNITAREEKSADRAKRLTTLVGGAILTPNEARKEEGREAMEGGDTLFVPSTLTPIEHALEPFPDPIEMAKAKSFGVPGEKPASKDAQRAALAQWERKALNRLKAGKSALCDFLSEDIAPEIYRSVGEKFPQNATAEDVKAFFATLMEESYAD